MELWYCVLLQAELDKGEGGSLSTVMAAFARPTRLVRAQATPPPDSVDSALFELPEEQQLLTVYQEVAAQVIASRTSNAQSGSQLLIARCKLSCSRHGFLSSNVCNAIVHNMALHMHDNNIHSHNCMHACMLVGAHCVHKQMLAGQPLQSCAGVTHGKSCVGAASDCASTT